MAKQLQADRTGAGQKLITWDDIGTAENIEVLVKIRATTISALSSEGFGIALRASGGAGSETAYTAGISSNDNVRVRRWNGGANNSVTDGSTGDNVATNTWYWLRFQVNGTAIKAKYWADGNAEPAAWQVDTTDGNVTGAGWAGLWGGGLNTGRVDCDWFSYAFEGETAPSPP